MSQQQTVTFQTDEAPAVDPNLTASGAAEGKTTDNDGSSDGDGKILGKFSSTEELIESYRELERKLGQGGSTDAEAGEASSEPVETPTAEEADQVVSDLGFDMNALSSEWNDNDGKLTDETRSALNSKGLSDEMIDAFIQGQEALATQLTNDIHNLAGGKDNFESMMAWANDNMTVDEKTVYNNVMESGSKDEINVAVKGLVAQYNATKEPNLLQGKGTSMPSGPKPYESRAQWLKDINTPDYKTDPAFRNKVMERMAVSNL